MRRLATIIVILALAASAAACAARPRDGVIAVSGSVADEEVVLAMPRLSPEPTASPDPGWSRVTSVPVALGDTVATGTVIALVDDGAAAGAVRVAEADIAESRAQAALLDERLVDVADKRRDVASTRSDVRRTLADLRDKRAQVAAQLAQARKLAASPPAGAFPPGGAVPPGAAPPGAAPRPQQDPRAIVARLEAALAQIDAGIAKAQSGLRKLNDASAQLADARSTLRSTRDVVRALIGAREASADLARARASLATVRAPAAGTVTRAPVLGQALAAGAPLARIRPTSAEVELVTYLTAAQARRVKAGDPARVRLDSLPGESLAAEVARVGSEYVYVPSRFATREIHLLRGFEVRMRLTEEATLPPGTPVDVTISPRTER